MSLLLSRRNESDDGGYLKQLWRFIAGFNYFQIAGVLVLLTYGAVFVWSTGVQSGNPDNYLRHLTWIGLGALLFLIMSIFDYRYLAPLAPILYGISLILLVLVLFSTPINNARSWLAIPGLGLRVQPSELAKLACIIMMAAVMSARGFSIGRPAGFFTVAGIAAVPFLLILIEPDFGSACVLLPIVALLMFVAGVRYRWVMTVLIALVILIPLAALNEIHQVAPVLKSYQRDRILTFINPDKDPHGAGYNLRQARLAVGSGGWTGKGIGDGTLSGLGYLPQTVTNNDFIFAVIAEESGFSGVALLLLAEMTVVLSCLYIGWATPDLFGRYLAVGMAGLLFCHIYINVGMCIGLAPISGLPLPLVSFGGSFMAMNLGALGILQSIWRYRKEEM